MIFDFRLLCRYFPQIVTPSLAIESESLHRLYFMFSNHLRLWPASDNPEKECRGQSFCLDFWLQWSQWPGLQGPEGKVGGGVQQEAQHLLRLVRVPLWRSHHPQHEARWVHRHIHTCWNRNCLWSWGRHSKSLLMELSSNVPTFRQMELTSRKRWTGSTSGER